MLWNRGGRAQPLRLLACGIVSLVPIVAGGQAATPLLDKVVRVVRDDRVPVIDGLMDEDVWADAAVVTDLHQLDPVEFAPPSQPTEIRIYYGDDALYVAARMWDSEPDRITAQVLRQGEGLASEDRFAVILDPYYERRGGYRFQVNPNGVRWDALYKNTSDLESNWEGIWLGAATRDAEGWTAEMAIPFKTLSFNPNISEWGINFERAIQRNDETIGWVSRNRELNPGVAGTAVGFSGLRQGVGLDVVPSVAVRRDRVFGATPSTTSDLEPSLDVFYKLTPSLNGSLTLNTDFSATEIDDRQVNLTRFSLFFPEKRDFFLQDADIFEFGRIGGNGGNPAVPGAAAQNGRPFFSRQLGLGRFGTPVDIEYGGKLSGRVGRWNLGALAIRQAEHEDVDATDVLVARVQANVLEESAVGVIVTDGDPQSNLESSLAGVDFVYRNTRLPGGSLLEGQAWYQQTDTQGVTGDDRAFGFGVSVPNATGWRGTFATRQIEENFDPAVGFVNRTGVRDHALNFGYRFRYDDRFLRTAYVAFDGYSVERLDTGAVESQTLSLRSNFNNNSQDSMFNRFLVNREVLLEDFEIYASSDGSKRVVIPPGDYTFSDVRVGVQTGNQRALAGRLTLTEGEFYSGDRRAVTTELTWRPSRHLQLGMDYQINEVDLPTGDFAVRLSSFRSAVAFSSTLSWVNLVQYDNVSENVGINSRLHWIPQAGREGFVVINHNLSDWDRNDSFHSTVADISVKFNYTLRF